MTDRRIRHLPVCVDQHLVGIVSIGDLVKSKIAETVAEAEDLRAYIIGGLTDARSFRRTALASTPTAR